jgi:transposase
VEFSVGIDVGARTHHVAILDPDGHLNEAFEIPHQQTGFDHLFSRLDHHRKRLSAAPVVGMEGLGGYARPLDQQIQKAGFSLLNLNNLKVNRFRQLFGADAKNDHRDAVMIAQMVRLRTSLAGNGERILYPALPVDAVHQRIKRLARRQQRLIAEKVRLLLRMKADLLAVCPSLLGLTQKIDTRWFLRLLVAYPDLTRLKRARAQAVLKIPGLGKSFLSRVHTWQTQAVLSDEADVVGPMLASDAARVLELLDQITAYGDQLEVLCSESPMAQRLSSLPGFGPKCTARLAGEIGTIRRFDSESALAVYLGVACLDHQSGTTLKRGKPARHVNKLAQVAMLTATDRHRHFCPESHAYYQKKRTEGKTHNQALRALARHLTRVIYRMLTQDRDYKMKILVAKP